MMHLSIDDTTGIVSLWDSEERRAKGAPNERYVDLKLTTKQKLLLAPPRAAVLECDAYIYRKPEHEVNFDPAHRYEVWLVPVGDGDNIINGFIAAQVDSFDKAVAALMDVTGLHITKIVSEV
jgi:hypothetical protein